MTRAQSKPMLRHHALVAGMALVIGINLGLLPGVAAFAELWMALLVPGLVGMSWIGHRELMRRPGPAPRATADAAPAVPDPGRDALTGLLNRPALVQRLEKLLHGRRLGEPSLAVLSVDLIDFSSINDTLGHVAGDLLLRHTAARLVATLRESDVVARMGADEFAVIQVDATEPAVVARLCERLLQALDEPFDLCGNVVYVGASIGVTLHGDDAPGAEAMLQRASLAMRRAESDGGKTFRFFEDGMDRALREQKALECDLHEAFAKGQLELHYQPLIDLASRRMVGVEALLRWHHPRHGRIAPDVFVPIAEQNGLIHRIGAWVLEEACAQAVRWREAGARELRMSVNVSPVQFQSGDLAAAVAGVLERTGLPAGQLELEITERVLMEHTAANLATLDRLRDLGVRISIDDFGVGHASLAYLARFPLSDIKLDRSFIAGLGREPKAAAIVKATLALGRNLGLVAVAEGVETESQLDFLRAEGCPLAQGFYFSPAVAAAEIGSMIAAGAAELAPSPDGCSLTA